MKREGDGQSKPREGAYKWLKTVYDIPRLPMLYLNTQLGREL